MNFRLLFPAALLTLLSLILIAASPQPYTQNADSKDSFFDRLSLPQVSNVTLTLDLDQILAENKYNDNYTPATFSHSGENWDVDVKVRGRYRRRVCDFPPLRIKFSKDMLEAAGLERHNKFKLVTHCSDTFDAKDNVLREQLAYELFALVNGDGYRTQVVNITYQDIDSDVRIERVGILIEDTDEMANRLGGEECDECFNLAQNDFRSNALETTAMFQYMIGNADWSARMQRNVKFVQLQAGGRFIAVPYDFDFAGMVDTEYAVPNPDLSQTDVKQRFFQWDFEATPDLQPTIDYFLTKEDAIMDHIENYTLLSKRSRRQVANYIGEFFESLRDGTFEQTILAQG